MSLYLFLQLFCEKLIFVLSLFTEQMLVSWICMLRQKEAITPNIQHIIFCRHLICLHLGFTSFIYFKTGDLSTSWIINHFHTHITWNPPLIRPATDLFITVTNYSSNIPSAGCCKAGAMTKLFSKQFFFVLHMLCTYLKIKDNSSATKVYDQEKG